MSIDQFAANLHRIADGLRNTKALLAESGEIVADRIKENIDRRQNASEFRVEDAGSQPGRAMTPLSEYTLAKREGRGVSHDHPLKDTGELYNSIGIRKSKATSVTIGARDKSNRYKLKKQLGTDFTGIESSDLKKPIPPRNPVGYNRSTYERVMRIWEDALGVSDSLSVTERIDIPL